jgi:hypothetical protein
LLTPQRMETEKNNLAKQLDILNEKLREQESNLEDVIAENSRLMIEIYNIKKSK